MLPIQGREKFTPNTPSIWSFNSNSLLSINTRVTSLRSLSYYFNKILDIFIELNLPITRVTPSGLKINYTNIKFESRKIKAKILKKVRKQL